MELGCNKVSGEKKLCLIRNKVIQVLEFEKAMHASISWSHMLYGRVGELVLMVFKGSKNI